jgi:glycosyltransferase involved in cell wall biosynthesis
MRASVIIRSKDEAARLRLTLASLARQSDPVEVVVVNDGSRDATRAVVDEASTIMPIIAIHNDQPLGRSAASNIGAERASGDIVIFLDGDTLAAPDLAAIHLALHGARPNVQARGETWHLRGARIFADPETGTPMPGEEARVAALPTAERARLVITREAIAGDFEGIHARAQPGIYPGAGPRRLYEMEMEGLIAHPECEVLWAASSGANFSLSRQAFLESGGFDDDLTINAHREHSLRMANAGVAMAPALGARTYHLTHRKGWRDPLADPDWEARFYGAHPIPEVALLAVLWAGFSDGDRIPPEARIASLPALEAAARRCDGVAGIEAVRAAHFAACARRADAA